ncbi:MAG TPA: ribonuclease Z [Pyrinomonadaceae bacterium]|nr:ribonuclease Z [Pyrinomonadaceae bacterium]
MQITFLGTSAGVPTRSRNVSCVALRLPERGEVWLFDCGEGTQHQLLKSELKISQITRIFITHLHGDHLFGLVGLLASAGMAGHASRIDIYGPPGLDDYVRDITRHSETHFSYSAEVHTVEAGAVFEDDDFTVSCRTLKHRVQTFGYRVTERDRPGAFDVERAARLGIPSGPLYGRLKRGERITLADGREFEGRDFCGPVETGRRIAYCTDTIYCRNAVELAHEADVLIHEATFARQDEDLARRSLHSTASMAARVALEAQARQLLITHLSPRYAAGNPLEPDDLLMEARATFPHTRLAHDFMTVEVARHKSGV